MEDPLRSIYLRSSKILEKKALLSTVCSCFAAKRAVFAKNSWHVADCGLRICRCIMV